ncbi:MULTISPECIES: hypothetical protein [Azospirillum]|uniref:Uncharacterized protein n=1 Tax=Azospirillum brasilense TaxID=192 RepID=A0ABU4PEC4_AZOBR|nr:MULTISPECIES: hypothetical protein [Azospirillum]MDW7556057.1 hypothetical protein [Azospirillum brasilense]MDW7596027.1 hypothetical protein [Azospirillum brasilense]MDW7631095.1 hypothetical protein [Azospirillum brasilense]MDX5955121.1 hypothetical protein [Azospirillum brasilense]
MPYTHLCKGNQNVFDIVGDALLFGFDLIQKLHRFQTDFCFPGLAQFQDVVHFEGDQW